MKLATISSLAIWMLALWSLTGCGVLGVKNIDAWGLKMEFQPGFDINLGANSIDKVDNRKGVNKF